MNDETTDVDLDAVWSRVQSQVWAPKVGHVEALAARLLRSPGLARALVTTPSLLLSWVLASAAVLALGAVVAAAIGTPVVPLLAPALAGAGIAYAYGPGTDPAYELSRTMPVSDQTVLLVRALAVFALNAVLGIAASLLVPAAGGVTLAWLVPMTAVAAFALATATMSGSANVGLAGGLAGWCIAILAGQVAAGRIDTATSAPVLVVPYLLFAAICVVVAVVSVPSKRGWS
ncbi:hypothetical protein GCM10029964_086990 [Kibdelosporangium lantanae]